ncbi:MAG: hypothetical protein RLO50_03060 [Azospirillaceae bacterium]
MNRIAKAIMAAALTGSLAAPAMAQNVTMEPDRAVDPVFPGAQFHEQPNVPPAAGVAMEQRLSTMLNTFVQQGFADYGPVRRQGNQYLVGVVTVEGEQQYWVLDGVSGTATRVENPT